MRYHISLEGLEEVFSKAIEDGGPEESDAAATWGCAMTTAFVAIAERLENIAISLERISGPELPPATRE